MVGVLKLTGVDNDENLNGGEIYHFIPPEGEGKCPFQNTRYYLSMSELAVVDLEVIKARTNVPSEIEGSRDEFRTQLLERDVPCVWTGLEPLLREDVHIIRDVLQSLAGSLSDCLPLLLHIFSGYPSSSQ